MAASPETTPEEILDEIGEDFLTCSICLEHFINPKILSCFHTFCEGCLEKLVSSNGGKLECSTCRKSCQVPSGGVFDLETNFHLKSLLEVVQKRSKKSQGVSGGRKCDFCEIHNVAYVCLECDRKQCCNNCATAHRRNEQTRSHRLLTLEDFANDVQPAISLCRIHNQKLEFYCVACQVCVCATCITAEHSAPLHRRQHLNQAVEDFKEQLRESLANLKAKVEEVDGEKTTARRSFADLREQGQQDRSKVTELAREKVRKAEETIRKVREDERMLLQKMNTDYKRRLDSAQNLSDDVEFRYGKVASMCTYVESLLRNGDPVQLVSSRNEIMHPIHDILGTTQEQEGGIPGLLLATCSSLLGVIKGPQEPEPTRHIDTESFEMTTNTLKELQTLRSPVCLPLCTIDNIPRQLEEGTPYDLRITTRNKHGEKVIPLQEIVAEIEMRDGTRKSLQPKYHMDGTHTVTIVGQTYMVNGWDRCVTQVVTVMIDKKKVPQSPFEVDVVPKNVDTYSYLLWIAAVLVLILIFYIRISI